MADVVVIGAGIAGCSVGWHLAAKHNVTVVERGSVAGSEASAHNAGMVRLLGEDPAERALAIRTADRLRSPGLDWDKDQLSRVTGAVLGLAHDPLHLHDGVAHLRAHGVAIEALQDADLVRIAPGLAGAPLKARWWLPEARVVDAHTLVQGLVRGLVRQGAAMLYNSPVQSLALRSGQVIGVQCPQGVIRADHVILAAGAWSHQLTDMLGVERPLYPLRRTLLSTTSGAVQSAAHPWCWIDDEGLYFRPETTGWLMSACDEHLDLPKATGSSRGAVQPTQRALLHDKVSRFLPALADVQSRQGWSGLRTFASDRSPMLGPDPQLPGLWWASALGGYGVTCSFGVGEALQAWLAGAPPGWLHAGGVQPDRHMLGRFPIRPTGQLHRPRLVSQNQLGDARD